MVKEKFEFHKLELPDLSRELLQKNQEIIDQSRVVHAQQKENQQLLSNKSASNIWFIVILAFIFVLIYLYYSTRNRNEKVISHDLAHKTISSYKPTKTEPSKATSFNTPKYVNYHDSIIFLNDIKDEKIVISKGFDDYLKKNKIIIKAGGNYYNCFCEDLFENYSVGQKIP